MDRAKRLPAVLDIEAHRIDRAERPRKGGRDGAGVMNVAFDRLRGGLVGTEQRRGTPGMPRDGAHGEAVAQKTPDDAAADEAGAAEDRDHLPNVGPLSDILGAASRRFPDSQRNIRPRPTFPGERPNPPN